MDGTRGARTSRTPRAGAFPFGRNKTNLPTYLGGASQWQQPPIRLGAGTLELREKTFALSLFG